jgi:hypothetical protein
MSALRQPRVLLTAEEYLRLERHAEFKSEYVNGHMYLVRQDRIEVEVFTRDDAERWSSTIYNEPADSFLLSSIDCTLTLTEVYEKVTFSDQP